MDDSILPIELCERIIDSAGVSNRTDGTVDYPTLRVCALVCCAWLPRARHNLFHRVVLRSAAHLRQFVSAVRNGNGGSSSCRVRELELGLPRWGRTDGWISLKEQPSLAALLHAHLTGISTLVLSRVQWVYPRKHLALMAQFRSVTTLELYYVRFATPSDVGQVLWSLPRLAELRCSAVYLQHVKHSAASAVVRRSCAQPQALQVMKLNGCSIAGAFILHYMVGSAQWLTSLLLRGSFVNWSYDTFSILASFHQLASLRLVLASPALHTALPSKTGLIATYRRATEAVLLQLATTSLRRAVVSFEPGLGTLDYLSGSGSGSGSGSISEARNVTSESSVTVPPTESESTAEAEAEAESTQPTGWSYGAPRSAALSTLLGPALEQIIADAPTGRVRERFAGLRMLGVRIWDGPTGHGQGGKDDAWWQAEVSSKALPTLHKLGLLRFEVMRDWSDGHLLWLDA